MTISVIVPTFNRGPALRETVRRLLANEETGLDSVQIIVVDDGSSPPAESVLSGLSVRPPFTLELLRQPNAGPARARNTGYRAASGDIVLFVDDDILVPDDLVRGHANAHKERPGSVVFGRCPWLPPRRKGAVFRLLDSLGYDEACGLSEEYLRAPIAASGQLSVERSMFDPIAGVYRDDLATPAAEEYELSLRLRRQGVEILLAPRLSAFHDSATNISALCQQQYKHGLGCAEAARRCPDTLELLELDRIIRSNAPVDATGLRLGDRIKALGASRASRALLVGLARLAEAAVPQSDAFQALYRMAIAAHFSGGVREGLQRYAKAAPC